MIREEDISNWASFLKEVKKMNPIEYSEKLGKDWYDLWHGLQFAQEGEVVISIVEGGNEIMGVGDSSCGYTPGIQVGVPIVIEHPNGSWYKGGTIESVDWNAGTFKTAQSIYAFHFVKK